VSKHNNFNTQEIKLKHEMWPVVLMLCGFGGAAIFLGLLLFANLAPTLNVVVNIAESISIGVGSIGIGSRIAQARRKNIAVVK
jgi:hypothetical protein